MSSRTAAARAGIGYTFANILIKGISFLSLPIFSRVLDTYDFGIYNVFISYDAILFVVIGFALHSSLKSANWEFPGKIDEYVSSISLLYLGNVSFLTILVFLFGKSLSELLSLDLIVIICLVIHSAGSALVTLYNYRVSLQYSYGRYMAIAATSSIGNIALSLLLIFTVFKSQRYLGRILGATIAFMIVGFIVLARFWRSARPKVHLDWWKYGLSYSMPIVFHGLSQVVLGQIGRLMINYMISTEAAGVYGLAANIQIVLTTLTDSIATVWTTWFYETMEGESADSATAQKSLSKEEAIARFHAIQSHANQLIFLFMIFTVILMALAPEMIWFLGGKAYMGGVWSAFAMILSGYCIFVYNILVVGEYYAQKTHFIMWATMGAASINAALNYVGISLIGLSGAAYGTLISYMLYVVFHWIISRKVIGYPIVQMRVILISCIILTVSASASMVFVGSPILRLAMNVVICIPVVLMLIKQVGGFNGIRTLIKAKD